MAARQFRGQQAIDRAGVAGEAGEAEGFADLRRGDHQRLGGGGEGEEAGEEEKGNRSYAHSGSLGGPAPMQPCRMNRL